MRGIQLKDAKAKLSAVVDDAILFIAEDPV
jgi:hypothetical protein